MVVRRRRVLTDRWHFVLPEFMHASRPTVLMAEAKAIAAAAGLEFIHQGKIRGEKRRAAHDADRLLLESVTDDRRGPPMCFGDAKPPKDHDLAANPAVAGAANQQPRFRQEPPGQGFQATAASRSPTSRRASRPPSTLTPTRSPTTAPATAASLIGGYSSAPAQSVGASRSPEHVALHEPVRHAGAGAAAASDGRATPRPAPPPMPPRPAPARSATPAPASSRPTTPSTPTSRARA
jgi:hypothetical protein